eukprot:14935267-Ditylum_brightwellii.AAC.1
MGWLMALTFALDILSPAIVSSVSFLRESKDKTYSICWQSSRYMFIDSIMAPILPASIVTCLTLRQYLKCPQWHLLSNEFQHIQQ